ncbi:MAG: hypothetical protein ABIQ53_03670 [Terracoccus sp.]
MITAGAYSLGGGDVSLPALAVLAVARWPVALISSAKRVTAPRLFIGLGAAQVVGHLLMCAPATTPRVAMSSMPGMLGINRD